MCMKWASYCMESFLFCSSQEEVFIEVKSIKCFEMYFPLICDNLEDKQKNVIKCIFEYCLND